MKIFIDTGIFIALFIVKDQYHVKVTKKYYQYEYSRTRFFTSHYILSELFTRILYDFGKHALEKVIKEIFISLENKSLTLLDIDNEVFMKSLDIMVKFAEHALSFTDVTCYVLYQQHHLDEIFTVDGGFKNIGAKTSF